jgi:alpha-D-ribose 1-methylphosphonate 5-triphosphate synthase subunit PhnG
METEQLLVECNLDEQGNYLAVLAGAPAAEVKAFVEDLLANLTYVEVIENRSGLVMLPYKDTVKGETFFLGEVLVSEAHVRVGTQEGYAACLSRDLEQALAIAILDALLQSPSNHPLQAACQAFVQTQAAAQAREDAELLRQVEATRVELEVF